MKNASHYSFRNFLFLLLISLLSFTDLSAQADTPCEAAQRWEEGASWNPDGTIDDAPNAGPINGIVRCGSSAETQSQVAPFNSSIYNSSSFLVDVSGHSCIDPSSGLPVNPLNPTNGQPIIWLNFDVRANGGSFQIQINDNSGDNIGWALYSSDSPTNGTSTGPSGDPLSGDCGNLTLRACGIESSSTWNTLPVPDFNATTNYYIAIWDQDADGDVQVNNFKARFGCGDADVLICNLEEGTPDATCNDDGTYTVSVPIQGINGEFYAYDPNATPALSSSVCLTNPGTTNVTSGTLELTYPQGTDYNITIFEATSSSPPIAVPNGACPDPDGTLGGADTCTANVSGTAPICFICPTLSNESPDIATCEDDQGQLLSVDADVADIDIEFVYFSSAQTDPYTGGTAIGIAVTPSGGTATSSTGISGLTPGTYYAYAILDTDDFNDPTCRPFSEIIIDITALPDAPVVDVTEATCDAAGTATITNYDDTLTYEFAPAGPTVGAGGVISGFDTGTDYTVTASSTAQSGESCTSAPADFNVAPILDPAVTPEITGDDRYCYDGNGVILDAGAGYASYLWSTGETTQMITVTAGSYTVTVTNDQGCEATSDAFTVESYEMLSCSIVQDALASNFEAADGVATVTPIGGSGDYTYLWDNGEITQTATALTYGLHTVTVTDAECGETTCEIFITKNLICSVSLISAATCAGGNDGVATVTTFGGYPEYSYSWDGGPFVDNPTNSELSAGSHTVTVMDSTGATTQCSVEVPGGGPVDLSCAITQDALATNFQSEDGIATVYPVGGSGAYTYFWDNGETTQTATSLTYGMHSVTVIDDNGCGETSCEIFIQKNLICSVRLDSPVSYAGGSDGQATVTAFGGYTPYTYSWDGGDFTSNSTNDNLEVGYHTVTIMDTVGNTTECSVEVTGPNDFACTITQTGLASNYLAADGSATVYPTGGSGGYTYAWDNGETTQTAIALTYGIHSVTVTDSNGYETVCEIFISKVLICSVTLDAAAGCSDGGYGVATVTAYGGYTPYTYSWDGGAYTGNATNYNLAAGDHTVTVMDATGATSQCSVTVTSVGEMSCSITQKGLASNFQAADGVATVNPMGGSGYYTYLWDNGETTQTATQLTYGPHSVTVTDANGCGWTSCEIFIDKELICSASQVSPATCAGSMDGVATVTGYGGYAPYSYSWDGGAYTDDNTADNLGVGYHTVTIKDATGATSECSVMISGPNVLGCSINITESISVFGASDGSATAIAIGGTAPYYYEWSNGETTATIEGLSAGIYTATITDTNGCSVSIEVTLDEGDTEGVVVSEVEIVEEETIEEESSTNEELVEEQDAESVVVEEEQIVTFEDSKIIPEISGSGTEVKAYPLTFVNNLNLKIEIDYDAKLNIRMYDMNGRTVLKDDSRFVKKGSNDLRFNVNRLAPDVYIMIINTGSETIVKKVMSRK